LAPDRPCCSWPVARNVWLADGRQSSLRSCSLSIPRVKSGWRIGCCVCPNTPV
jgi:hypothetical protein